MVDTGAGRTTLMPLAMVALGLSPNDFKGLRQEAASGIGGRMRFWVDDAELAFTRDDGRIELVTLEVGIAAPSDHNLLLPSLIGRDLLSYYRFTSDARTGEVSIERDRRCAADFGMGCLSRR